MERPKPEAREAYGYFATIATRWMDNDVYGHVNNVVYYSFFDTVVNRYLIVQGVLDPERGTVIGLVAETQCRFLRPVSFPDIVHAGLRVAHIGNSSARYEIGVFRNDEPLCAALGHVVHVYVDRASRRPVRMPDALRAALEKIRRP